MNFKLKASNNNIKNCTLISSNPLEISNFLNKHFTTVAAKIEDKIVKTNKNFHYYLKKTTNERTLSVYLTTPTEAGYIKNINIRKSVGLFRIPNRVLKGFNKTYAIPISHIYLICHLIQVLFPKK